MNDKKITLKEKLNRVPAAPGVYKMLDDTGRIIYIGKSKCLNKRVKSYFVPNPKWDKARIMKVFIKDIEVIVTDTHLEAMLLECELIKDIKPFFNVKMKNDKRYAYLKLSDDVRSQPIHVTLEKEAGCIGPFRSKGTLEEFRDSLRNLYPIKMKDGKYQLDYHIFPVHMDSTVYGENLNQLRTILEIPSAMALFIEGVQECMDTYASLYQYEKAARYYSILNKLRYLQYGMNRYCELETKDMILQIKLQRGHKYFYISQGRVVHKRKYARISEENQLDFVEKSNRKKPKLAIVDEKSLIDYRDIIYSEILRMPKETVIIL